ncbi:MAG: FHA domain-containing protein FhaA [candidate division BRC1 bacterium ADurb.BinA364]|nr:MAG: FHA domain-containing protein FhaA [candidate division BRC1 bacterium ADurb.BinA364]
MSKMRIKFYIHGGDAPARTVVLEGDSIVFGRSQECQLRLEDPFVSRRHARIEYDRLRGCVLSDLHSRNGLTLNDRTVKHPSLLRPGDELRFGPIRVIVQEMEILIADDTPIAKPPAAPPAARPAAEIAQKTRKALDPPTKPSAVPPLPAPAAPPAAPPPRPQPLAMQDEADSWRDKYEDWMQALRGDFDRLWAIVKPRTPASLAAEIAAAREGIEAGLSRLHRIAEGIREANDRLLKLLEAARVISAPQPLKERLETILDLAIEKMGANCGFLMLYSRRRNGLSLALQRGLNEMPREMALEGDRLPPEPPRAEIAREAVRSGSTVFRAIAGGAAAAKADSLATQGVHAAICAPMKVEKRFLGLIYVEFRDPKRLADRAIGRADADWLDSLGSLAALAIENARLIQKNRDKSTPSSPR